MEVLLIALIGICPIVAAQNAPVISLYPADIYGDFLPPGTIPPPEPSITQAMSLLQVGRRNTALGLTQNSASQAWQNARSSLSASLMPRSRRRNMQRIVFAGSTASALNQTLANADAMEVQVTAGSIGVDQPIEITRAGVRLDLGTALITGGPPQGYMLRIENTNNVRIRGGEFSRGDSAILISGSAEVEVQDVQVRDVSGAGIVITNSSSVRITGSQIANTALAGVMLHRNTTDSLVDHNALTGMAGFSNTMAAIVLTDREVDVTANPRTVMGPDGYWVIPQPITARMHPPHDNLIAWNHIEASGASGIYSDGGIRNVVYGNTITASAKEGLCLDNGSTANVVAMNELSGNGNRWGEPDSVLALDSVMSGGRLPDGTPAEKLPGISLDNAVWNVVFANNIVHNAGGGVKIVRTGYFNAIGLNTLIDDNDGASVVFHYFGIELGATPGDTSSIELDFTPSRGNVVFSNSIRGDHYSGIFFDAGSDQNNVIYNTILDASNWALESVAPMANYSLNNLTTIRSRNIGSGVDPSLVSAGQPVFDGATP